MPLITESTPARIVALLVSLLLLFYLIVTLFVFNKTIAVSLKPIV